jgi:mono/diheme cytochrome c family protein
MKLFLATAVLLGTVSTAFAQSGRVAKQEGPMLFKMYCATCHGLDGKGGGPTASSLKKAPADLTQLQLPGKPFPGEHVVYVISGQGEIIGAHGSREMPVWGRVFRYTRETPPSVLAVNRLTDYLKAIQVNK